jgi:hypothetical protein
MCMHVVHLVVQILAHIVVHIVVYIVVHVVMHTTLYIVHACGGGRIVLLSSVPPRKAIFGADNIK